ncbi:hypothetical protein JB92DRAFT_1443302 [Gautieria morchelliformis]|nr:hypothetical protein JB92DRAFT_1443302 [Gautieria morchelliformis]
MYIRQTDVCCSAVCSADQGLKRVCSLRETWLLFVLALHSGYALSSRPRSPFVWLRLQQRLETYLRAVSCRHKLAYPLAFVLSLPGASRMSSEATDSSRMSRISCIDTLPRFLEEQAPSSPLTCSHSHPTESHGIGIDNTQSFIEKILSPAHVHVHESSPSISGYLASVQPLSCSPNTSSGTTLTNTAVSGKTSSEDQRNTGASSPADAGPQRFRRRIWSAFFLYFVSL